MRINFNQLLVSNDKKFVYHFIPRASCSTLKYHLHTFIEGATVVAKEDVDVPYSPLHESLGKVAKRVADLYNYDDYFKFLVVRNPYDRIISSYFEYIVPKSGRQFSAFIKQLETVSEWPPHLDHFMPISHMCCSLYIYSKIYKVEENAHESIQKDLGISFEEGVHFSSSKNNYYDLSKEDLDYFCSVIDRLYAEDLKIFDYTVEDSQYLKRMNYRRTL